MSERCGKCDSDVGLLKDGIKCSDCAVVCHVRCVGVVTRNKKWKCDGCVLECSSNPSASNAAILEAINAFRKESNDKWQNNEETLNIVRSDVTSIKSEFEVIKAKLEDLQNNCTQASENVKQLKEDNKRLSCELTAVKMQVSELEQHSRKNNILISGMPVTAKESVPSMLSAIAKALGVNYNGYDISAAHRLRGNKGDNRPPSIVVCFVSRWVKNEWLAARRKKRSLQARDIVNSFPNTPVYLNEHLTPHTRTIFNGARSLVKERKLSSVWTSDCRVMARLTPDHRPFHVRDQQHVAELSAGTTRTVSKDVTLSSVTSP